MNNPKNVYCDCDELMEKILSVHPSSEGLFPHELMMILTISWGSTTTDVNGWSGYWGWVYCVKQPKELLLSLIERGFIRECSNEELFIYAKTRDFQKALKIKGIKSGNTREKVLEVAKQNLTADELFSLLGFHYYILTDEGKKVCPIGEGSFAYPSWDTEVNLDIPKLKKNQIKKRGLIGEDFSGYDLYIDSLTLDSKLYLSGTKSEVDRLRTKCFNKPPLLKVYVDNDFLCQGEGINTYRVLRHSNKLLLGIADAAYRIDYEVYDLSSRAFLCRLNLSFLYFHQYN